MPTAPENPLLGQVFSPSGYGQQLKQAQSGLAGAAGGREP
jgi:hypothetical protein